MWQEFHVGPEYSTVSSWLDAEGRKWSWVYIEALLRRWLLFAIKRSHSAFLSTIMLKVNFRFASCRYLPDWTSLVLLISSESCCAWPLLRPFGLLSLTPGPTLFLLRFPETLLGSAGSNYLKSCLENGHWQISNDSCPKASWMHASL